MPRFWGVVNSRQSALTVLQRNQQAKSQLVLRESCQSPLADSRFLIGMFFLKRCLGLDQLPLANTGCGTREEGNC